MRSTHKIPWTSTLLAVLALGVGACDGGKEAKPAEAVKKEEPKPAAEVKPVEEAKPVEAAKKEEPKPTGPAEVVLEPTEIANLGTILMPKGYKTLNESAAGGNFTFALTSESFGPTIYIDFETAGGVKNLKKAESTAKIFKTPNDVQVDAKTLKSGVHQVIFERPDDGSGMGEMAIVWGFNSKGYVKCWGPKTHRDKCEEIIASAPAA